jgi:hypothetical protein
MVGRGGTIGSSQRGYGKLGAVEQAGSGSAVVDEGGLARGLARVIDQMVYVASFGISEGTWGL